MSESKSPIAEHFMSWIRHIDELRLMTILASYGIKNMAAVDWDTVDFDSSPELREVAGRVDMLKTMSDFARLEIDREFFVLHGWILPSLWSGLEHLVQNVLVDYLVYFPEQAYSPEKVRKLKVSISDFRARDEIGQAAMVLKELERSLSATEKRGCGRFEEVLNVFGFSGEIAPLVKDAIYELAETRHLFAHRRGIVDTKFLDACPNVQASLNEPLRIPFDTLLHYFDASISYGENIRDRITMKLLGVVFTAEEQPGIDPPENEAS